VKRQAELVDMAERGQLSASGRGYHVNDLGIMSMIALGSGYVSVLVMALYINSPAVLNLYNLPAALWGICCVLLYWVTRMVMITHRGSMHYDPVVFAAKGLDQLDIPPAHFRFCTGWDRAVTLQTLIEAGKGNKTKKMQRWYAVSVWRSNLLRIRDGTAV